MPTLSLARAARLTIVALTALVADHAARPATATAAVDAPSPAPAAAPARPSDDDEPNPELLAYTISQSRDRDSVRAAIREAIRASGLGVRAPGEGVVVEPAEPAQGIWFDPLELEWMERGYEKRVTTSLGDLAKVLARGAPRFGQLPFAATLMQDLREDAKSEVPTRAFYARFVLALGDWHDAGGGAATPPDSVRLDAVQLAFVTRRLHADVALSVPGGVEKFKRTGLLPATPVPAGETRLGLAAPARRQSGPRAGDAFDASGAFDAALAAPCTLTDTEATILDYTAAGFGFGFGKVADMIGGNMGSYASAAAVASTLASYAKLALMFTFLQAKWEPEGKEVLVRTKSMTTPGERKTLTVRLTYDINDLQMVNCVRTAFNAVGFDFSMPNGGAISDAEVDFSTMEGQTTANYDFWNRSQGFEPGYVEMTGNPLGVPTDAGGRARVTVQGMKQRERVPETAEPFDRPASMQARARMTKNDLVKELPGAVGIAASGGLMVLVNMIPELITRSAVPVSTHRFTVRDWAYGYRVTITSEDHMWGTAVEDPETCPGVARDGSDVIEGFIPVKSGSFLESTNVQRRTSMPICDIKPVFERTRNFSGWEGKFCSARLTGTQRLSVDVEDDTDEERGRGVRVRWRLVPRSAQAQVAGDCLQTRFNGPVSPDHEFMTQITRDEYRRAYQGEKGGGGPPGIAGGSVFIPASAMKGKGDTITASDGGWQIELRMVGLK